MLLYIFRNTVTRHNLIIKLRQISDVRFLRKLSQCYPVIHTQRNIEGRSTDFHIIMAYNK